MRQLHAACLVASFFLAPAIFSPSARAQGDAIPAPPIETHFRYDGRVFRAALSITTYTPGILVEGQTNADSTYAWVSIQSIDGQPVPSALQSAILVVNTRRRGLRLPLSPSPVAIQAVGYAAMSTNFAYALPAGQRLGARVEFHTPRGRVSLNFNSVVVGLAAPNV